MAASFAICIATYGDEYWNQLAHERALASAYAVDADEIWQLHEPSGKRHATRNSVALNATTEWLVFVDADDHLHPSFIDALRRVAPPEGTKALLNPSVGHWNEPDNHACFAPKDLRDGNYLIIGTAVPRKLFLEVGGFYDWGGFEDWELWIRCVKAGASVIQVPDAVYLIDSTERSVQASAPASETSRWLSEIRRYHWPELYGRSGKRVAGQ